MANYKVVDADQLDADLTAVADAIRAKTSGTEKLAFPDGMIAGVWNVYDAGRSAEYNDFWDVYQDYGARTGYPFAFYSWRAGTFNPKYPITCTASNSAQQSFGFFQGSTIEVPIEIAVPAGSTNTITASMTFYYASLVRIARLILGESVAYNNTFQGCTSLEELNVEGTIGKSGFNVSWSKKLTKASITSIVNALSATTSGLTVTISLTAVNTSFETSSGAGDGSSSAEWTALAGTKSNWTISLVDA